MKALLAVSLALLPVPVLAYGAEQPSASEGQQKEPLICRHLRVNASGSRVRPQRVCKTRLQWRQHDDISTDDVEDSLGVLNHEQQTSTYTGGLAPR